MSLRSSWTCSRITYLTTMINKDYLYVRRYEDCTKFEILDNSLYLYCVDVEDRSKMCVSHLSSKYPNTDFVELEYIQEDEVRVIELNETFKLKSDVEIMGLIERYEKNRVYLEVSGMSNRLSAPLLKRALKLNKEVHVIYAEPDAYDPDVFRQNGLFENHPKQYDGIKPLPSLAAMSDDDDRFLFVALLGFEGGRFAYLLDNVQPMDDRVLPVLGVPGYRMEYPFVSFWGNQSALLRSNAKDKIRYAAANSIVDAYLLLKRLFEDNHGRRMMIAPIGTKPHCIAAILFAIKQDKNVEVVYDNPIHTVKLTKGLGAITDSDVSKLINEN